MGDQVAAGFIANKLLPKDAATQTQANGLIIYKRQ